MVECAYGCGNEGKYQLKNGKWCCEIRISKCPAIRAKNSASLRKAFKDGTKKPYDYKSLPQETKDKMAWNRGKTKETDERIAKTGKSLSEHNKIYGGTFKGRKHTEETKKLISKRTSEAYNYEAERKSGRGKKVDTKGSGVIVHMN